MADNIFDIYYRIGRALPFEVRRFPDGRVSDWYRSQSVLVTKIAPKGDYGHAWGYYLRNGKREDSHWCRKSDTEPRPIPCCGCGGWVLVNAVGTPTTTPNTENDEAETPKPKDILGPADTMRFGKYKGKTIAQVKTEDEQYLRWAEANVAGFALDWEQLVNSSEPK